MHAITIHLHCHKDEIDPAFFDQLNHLAAAYGMYIENTQSQSEQNFQKRKYQLDQFILEANALAKSIGPQSINSTDLIREDREKL